MENTSLNEKKDEDSINTLMDCMKIEEDDGSVFCGCKSKSQVNRVYPEYTLAMNVQKSQSNDNFIKHLYQYTTTNKIPKHIVSLDERYLRWCLEMIHISAAKSATCNVYLNSSLMRMGTLRESTMSPGIHGSDLSDSARVFIKCSLLAGSGDAITCPSGQWSLGSTDRNESLTSVLKSPLFQQLGASENTIDLSRTVTGENRAPLGSNHVGPSGGFSIYSPLKLGKQQQLALNHYESDVLHDRLNSMSSLNSVFQDQSSSACATISHGMLRSRWSGGIPQFVFSLDSKRETYVAEILKSEAPDSRGQSWTYLFYLKAGNLKEHEIYGHLLGPVGKMKVSTTVQLCPTNSRVLESEFVLFDGIGSKPDVQSLSQSPVRNKLSKKVVDIFKPSHSSKHRTNSSIWEASSSLDYCPWEQGPDAQKSLDVQARFDLLENDLPPNFELAAIVIREQLPMIRQESESKGWGLKFLQKAGRSNNSITKEAPPPSGRCQQSSEECGTSTNILIPAGCHGGPKTRTRGPSSLVERWKSGGHCDCGGWDIGCPLTVLNVRSHGDEVLLQTDDDHWELKSYDLFRQGTKGNAATVKMVNIRNGLHYIDFESTLSGLQAFAVTVAILHNQNPSLRPRDV